MRIGNNPLRGMRVETMPEIVAAVITHLPNLKGYHAGRLEVIQHCLNSLRGHAGRDLPVMVWDNGSGPELRDWLLHNYKPEFLMLSPNIGKTGGRTSIVRMFPPWTIVCISDDDMYYHPNWLEPQLQLLNHFPNVGAVSGYPVHTQFRWGTESTLKWAKENGAKIERGQFIPEAWNRDFCRSVGREWNHFVESTAGEQEIIIEWRGVRAFATAHHCQFIAKAEAIEYIVQWDGEAMSDEKMFDKAIDGQGLLRLTTTERLVQHMGNVMDDELKRTISRPERQRDAHMAG